MTLWNSTTVGDGSADTACEQEAMREYRERTGDTRSAQAFNLKTLGAILQRAQQIKEERTK